MKGAVASVDIFAFENETSSKRLTLTIAAPEPRPEGEGWQCRLVLADVHRPEIIRGTDSVDALARAIARSGDRASPRVGDRSACPGARLVSRSGRRSDLRLFVKAELLNRQISELPPICAWLCRYRLEFAPIYRVWSVANGLS